MTVFALQYTIKDKVILHPVIETPCSKSSISVKIYQLSMLTKFSTKYYTPMYHIADVSIETDRMLQLYFEGFLKGIYQLAHYLGAVAMEGLM